MSASLNNLAAAAGLTRERFDSVEEACGVQLMDKTNPVRKAERRLKRLRTGKAPNKLMYEGALILSWFWVTPRYHAHLSSQSPVLPLQVDSRARFRDYLPLEIFFMF